MVCHRCKMVARTELEKLKLHPVNIALGEVVIEEKQLSKEQLEQVAGALKAVSFELMDDRKSKLIEQIKTFVIDAVHYKEEQPKKNYSELLSQHLHHDYSHLSNLFSEVEGTTIEQCIINQKMMLRCVQFLPTVMLCACDLRLIINYESLKNSLIKANYCDCLIAYTISNHIDHSAKK